MNSPEKKWRMVIFTSQDIGFQLVDHLTRRDDIDLFVVTNRTARDDSYFYRSAIDVCERSGTPFVKTGRVDADLILKLAAFKPDLIVSAYYPHIIPKAAQCASKSPAVNVHPGLLPRYRGKFPTPWYILNGEAEFGMAIHRLDGGIDTGDVLIQAKYPIAADETGHGLYRKTMDHGAALLIENIDALLRNSLPAAPQEGVGTYYSSIEKRFQIDWNMTCESIRRRIRVHAKPYFPAYTFLLNHMISINRASLCNHTTFSAQGGGFILKVEEDGKFAVSCCDGCLLIEEYEVCPSCTPEVWPRLLRVGSRCD